MPTTTALIEPKTKIVGANHTDVQISANPWNQSRVVTGGTTGGLFARDAAQTDGWGLVDAAAGVLRCSGAGTLPAWSNDGAAGIWVPVAYSGANFAGTGGMTWTVDSGDQTRFSYLLNGKAMTVSFWLSNTTRCPGTAAGEIRLTIPAGGTSAGICGGPPLGLVARVGAGVVIAPASRATINYTKRIKVTSP
jgi:hypothetical protein